MATSPVVPEVENEDPSDAGEVQTFGERNKDLPKCLVDAISDCFETLQQREAYDRRIEVLTDRMHRFYDEGIQHYYPNYGTGTYQIGSAGATINIGQESINCPDYIGAYNIFYPVRRSLEAVLTQNPPGIDFRPDDPSRPEDMEAAETAEGYRHYFDQANDVKQIQQAISRMFCLSGRTVCEVETIEDEQKWGLNDQGQPRKMETVSVFGTLESKVPILAKCLEQCSYAFLYSDQDALMAKEEFDWIASKIQGGQGGLGESEWERYARVGVKQARKGYFLTGNSGAHITTKIKGYLRPAVFGKYKELYEPSTDEDPQGGDGKTTIGDKLKEVFPDGCRAIYVGQNYACSENMSMDDHIAVGFPKDVDGMSGGALMRDCVVLQDVFNDYKNATRSYYEKGWPSLWIRTEEAEYDAIVSQAAEPAAIRLLKSTGPADQPAGDSFYREPDMELPESFIQECELISGPLIQMISGALPALQGSSKADQTASGQAMDRSQAMGMLGMPWANEQRLFAKIYYMAALLAAQNPDHAKDIVVPGDGSTNTKLSLAKLTKGKFMAHPDTDSSFPESTAAKRANLQQVMTSMATNPEMAQEFLASPDNWEEMLDLMGFPELELTPAEAYKKQVREFEILLRESPIPADPQLVQQMQIQHASQAVAAQQMGQPIPPFMPPPPTSSVPVGKYDYHKWELAKCQEWLSSEACWRAQAEGNQAGIENITLHADAHANALAQQAAAMAPPPPVMPPGKPQAPHAPEATTAVQNNSAPPTSI